MYYLWIPIFIDSHWTIKACIFVIPHSIFIYLFINNRDHDNVRKIKINWGFILLGEMIPRLISSSLVVTSINCSDEWVMSICTYNNNKNVLKIFEHPAWYERFLYLTSFYHLYNLHSTLIYKYNLVSSPWNWYNLQFQDCKRSLIKLLLENKKNKDAEERKI